MVEEGQQGGETNEQKGLTKSITPDFSFSPDYGEESSLKSRQQVFFMYNELPRKKAQDFL